MQGFRILALLSAIIPISLSGQNLPPDEGEVVKLDSVVVSVSRAGGKTPVSYTMLGRGDLKTVNPSWSLPMALSLQPSVVSYNEGGTGLGNSMITIRGSKGSQINVTLNGITLNDSESQEVFWVNIPSLVSLISSVQVQRGLGTSASGSGAFGASINMSTASVGASPYGKVNLSYGSWNTAMAGFSAGTGLLKSGLYFDIAYNQGHTDGYIENGKVNSHSLFAVLGYLKGNNSLRFTYLSGYQRSGITWDGIDLKTYETNRRYNGAGVYKDDEGNARRYGNHTDNYFQDHFQLNYTRVISDPLCWTTTLNYTRGDGYDEYYKTSRTLKNFALEKLSEQEKSDMIYRKKMGNDYYVLNSDLKYTKDALRLTGGVSVSAYNGEHFGQLLWVKALGDSYDFNSYNSSRAWYSNTGDKRDFSAFVRAEYDITPSLTAYADLQGRHVSLVMDGRDDDYLEYGGTYLISYDKKWNFFNPRAGLSLQITDNQRIYGSVSLGHREPGRSDVKENIKGTWESIKPESMIDLELGWALRTDNLQAGANLYAMEYKDMLLETGRLSSSGYAIKENVPSGYRRGLELSALWNALSWLDISGTGTFSRNRINNYVAYPVSAETKLPKRYEFGDTDMLLSPSVTASALLLVTPWKNLSGSALRSTSFAFDGRFVSSQYMDNSSRDALKIPSYWTAGLTVSHTVPLRVGAITATAYVANIFNRLYYAYGYKWWDVISADGSFDTGCGVYPQAPRNFTIRLSYEF